ncbi:dodecin family protein [Halalkalicoccus ordinarius]|uniref:dodecin family protein n=1 Tax=Halalkalicoccus ordinarius TaxID=3116651 RepID=UPI00300E6F25
MTTVKVIELQGESDESWEDAAQSAVQDASDTLQGISGIEVVSQTADIDDDGQITRYNTTVNVAFTLQRD